MRLALVVDVLDGAQEDVGDLVAPRLATRGRQELQQADGGLPVVGLDFLGERLAVVHRSGSGMTVKARRPASR